MKLHAKSNPIFSKELEEIFAVKGPTLRGVIRTLRRSGEWIAESEAGYYYADSFEQVEPTILDLEGRADSMYKTASAMRKAIKPEQQTLFT